MIRSFLAAAGDGSGDDSQALQDIIDQQIAQQGGAIVIPEGVYRVTSGLTIPAHDDLTIVAEGRGAVIQSALTSGTVLDVGTEGSAMKGLRVHNLTIRGGGSEDLLASFGYCLDALLDHCTFEQSASDGVFLGRPQNMKLLGCEIRDNTGWGAEVGPFDGNTGQLARFLHTTVKGNGTGGIFLNGGGEHLVFGCQIEDQPIGILNTSLRNDLSRNTFELCGTNIRWGVSGGAESGRSTVTHNKFVGGLLDFVHYQGERFEGNTLEDRSTGEEWTAAFAQSATGPNAVTLWRGNYELPNGPQNGRITNNANAGTIVYEDTVDNVSTGGRRTFADGDTTPDVSGFRAWVAENSTSTTITALDGGYEGKQVTIRFANVNTTLAQNSNLRLAGATNYTGGTRDTITLVCDDGTMWYEVARSNN